MADFSALKQSIQNYIKQNGNKEITGAILQNILLSMVTTMGDGAINEISSNIDSFLSAITTRLNTGALYAGYATPSTTPAALTSQEVFYLATQAGTYTNFHFNGGDDPIVLAKDGIYFIVSGLDDDDWNAETMLQLDDEPTAGSDNLVKSGGVSENLVLQKTVTVTPISTDKVIRSITRSNVDLTVVLEDFCIFANNKDADHPWTSYNVAGTQYVLNNVFGIVANLKTGTVSVENIGANSYLINAVEGSDKVLLYVNFLGRLYSAIPSLQTDLTIIYGTDAFPKQSSINPVQSQGLADYFNLQKSLVVVGKVKNEAGKFEPFVQSVSLNVSTLSVDVIISDVFHLTGTNNYIMWVDYTLQNRAFSIGNVCALVADFSSMTVEVVNCDGTGFKNGVTPYNKVVLLFNFAGKLYSPIASVQLELDKIYSSEEEYNTVIVSPTSTYTSVRAAVQSITDASSVNKYRILVKNGTYNEIDIETKDYVDIVGESREGVVLVCDGNSTENAPNGYGLPMWTWLDDYSGQAISSIPKDYKHLFIHMSNSKIANVTMLVNNVKYAIHQDGNGRSYYAVVENCDIIRRETYDNTPMSSLVGVGAIGGQHQKYVNCNFYMEIADAVVGDTYCAFLWHNWNNQVAQCSAVLDGCNIYGCNVAKITELGSEQNDKIIISNTIADKPQYGIVHNLEIGYYKINGQVVTDPTLIPYSIKIDVISSNVNYIVCSKDRVGAYENNINDSNTIELDRISGVLIGQPITPSHIFGIVGAAIATDKNFVFTATSPNSKYYIKANKGAVGLGLCVAGTYISGDDMYISNGKFTNIQNGSKVGICLESVTIQNDELIRIQRT